MWHALSWLHDVPEPAMLFLTCDLVFLWSGDYDIWHYSTSVLHAHYIHAIVYVHDIISHDLVFCYSRWYFICQFILRQIHYSFIPVLYLYCPFTFTFSHHCFLFLCVHLLVRFWQTLIFQHHSLKRLTSYCSKEPRKTIRHESKIPCLLYFGICLVMKTRCQNCIFYISALFCSLSCIQTKTIVNECLLCEMKYLVVFCRCVREFGSFTTA